MPSDKTTDGRVERSLAILEKAREDFHSALVATSEELRGLLDAGSGSAEARAERTAAELGAFAVGHIDVDRFSAFEETGEPVAVTVAPKLEAASRTLQSLLDRGDDLFLVRAEAGKDLREVVSAGLARAGRAFGAARTVELARSGRYDEAQHGEWLNRFPPSLWSGRERKLAPPIVVEIEGTDLLAGGLADFLDGAQKIVLVVRGPAPPAELSRLITPGLMVVQAEDPADLSVLAETEGPAVAALLPDGAARFVHLPEDDGGRGRLTVNHMPEDEPKRALGRVSVYQQAEGLRHLASLAAGWGLAAAPAAAPSGDGAAAPAASTAADTLAAWILRQADLPETG